MDTNGAAPDMSGDMGDMGGADTPSVDTGASREPAQVIPRGRGGEPGDDGGDDDAGAANDNGTPKTRVPKPTKHKTKFFGQERELSSMEEALALLNDDYEHEITVSGEKRKAKYPDLVRGYQLSEGAHDRMRKAAEVEKTIMSRLEHGKKDPGWALEMVLGVPDHVRWAAAVVRNQISQEKELDELYNTDRFEWQQRMNKLADERKARRDAFEVEQKRGAERQKQQAEYAQRLEADVRKAVEGAGMPWNSMTRTLAGEIRMKFAKVGHELPPGDIAAMAREEWHKLVSGHLDALDEEGLVKFLGDERRKKLRKYELQALQRGGKTQETAKAPATNGARRPEPSKGMTEKEYKEQFRRG